MATLVLGAVGTAIGGAFGGAILGFSGAAIGGFIGSTVGSVVDSWIVSSLAPAQRIEGARLDTLRITSATEGAVIPPLALAKAFSRSGCGRIFPLFSGVMREGLSTGPVARTPESGLWAQVFSEPHDWHIPVFSLYAPDIAEFSGLLAEHFDFGGIRKMGPRSKLAWPSSALRLRKSGTESFRLSTGCSPA
ncbi:hypothetical protein Rsw2DRAFT_3356 [Rhodobacter ferrooxidans]|uniref:Uncharacterized protein n=1 Tax=Rhodobacter ferrooxidans TaxID=371731 RepID=C8S5M7_9RHOB|nr:hypothetical protein Rsw2DRAFT_3356 [Rhodobacter sp. SW2]